jgi:hypothetical protein
MSTSGFTYDQVQNELSSRFPEIRNHIKSTFAPDYDLETETPGGYPIFEDVVEPFLLELIESGRDEALLTRLFDFFEEMASSEDGDVTDLLRIAILETLVYHRECYQRARQYMGRKTKEFAEFEEHARSKQERISPL